MFTALRITNIGNDGKPKIQVLHAHKHTQNSSPKIQTGVRQRFGYGYRIEHSFCCSNQNGETTPVTNRNGVQTYRDNFCRWLQFSIESSLWAVTWRCKYTLPWNLPQISSQTRLLWTLKLPEWESFHAHSLIYAYELRRFIRIYREGFFKFTITVCYIMAKLHLRCIIYTFEWALHCKWEITHNIMLDYQIHSARGVAWEFWRDIMSRLKGFVWLVSRPMLSHLASVTRWAKLKVDDRQKCSVRLCCLFYTKKVRSGIFRSVNDLNRGKFTQLYEDECDSPERRANDSRKWQWKIEKPWACPLSNAVFRKWP